MPTVLFTDLPEVRVDFNSSLASGSFRVSQATNPEIWPSLAIDTWVLAGDSDGNYCAGRVSAMHGLWAELEPDWPTWISSDENPIVWSVGIKDIASEAEEPSLNSYVALEGGLQAARSGVFEPQRQEAALAS